MKLNYLKKQSKNQKQIGSEFEINSEYLIYSIEYFEFQDITDTEIKTLTKLFDLDNDGNTTNAIGIFPDALEQAYDERINLNIFFKLKKEQSN